LMYIAMLVLMLTRTPMPMPMPMPVPVPMPNLTGRVYRYGARNCVFTGVQPWIRLGIYFPRSWIHRVELRRFVSGSNCILPSKYSTLHQRQRECELRLLASDQQINMRSTASPVTSLPVVEDGIRRQDTLGMDMYVQYSRYRTRTTLSRSVNRYVVHSFTHPIYQSSKWSSIPNEATRRLRLAQFMMCPEGAWDLDGLTCLALPGRGLGVSRPVDHHHGHPGGTSASGQRCPYLEFPDISLDRAGKNCSAMRLSLRRYSPPPLAVPFRASVSVKAWDTCAISSSISHLLFSGKAQTQPGLGILWRYRNFCKPCTNPQ
jgi:hypothetical protein